MWRIFGKLIAKAAEKANRIDASDTFTQMNVDDVVSIIKAIIF